MTEVSQSFRGHNCRPLRQDVTWLCVFQKSWGLFESINLCQCYWVTSHLFLEFLICHATSSTTARGWKFQAALRLSREMSIAKRTGKKDAATCGRWGRRSHVENLEALKINELNNPKKNHFTKIASWGGWSTTPKSFCHSVAWKLITFHCVLEPQKSDSHILISGVVGLSCLSKSKASMGKALVRTCLQFVFYKNVLVVIP